MGLTFKDYDRGDGACRHLTKENLCGIYESRPAFCRVDNFNVSDSRMIRDCNTLQELLGIQKSDWNN